MKCWPFFHDYEITDTKEVIQRGFNSSGLVEDIKSYIIIKKCKKCDKKTAHMAHEMGRYAVDVDWAESR